MDYTLEEQLEELEDLTGLVAAEIEAACGSLEGMCTAGALGLMHAASQNEATRGLELVLVKGRYGSDVHWWVEVGGQVFDPTEDQFQHAASYVGEVRYEAPGEIADLRREAAAEFHAWATEGGWDVQDTSGFLGLDDPQTPTQGL